MSKISIVGPRSEVLCYLCVGFSVYFTDDKQSACDGIDKAVADGSDIIFISPEFGHELDEKIASYSEMLTPAISFLPPKDGEDPGVSMMRSAVERAVGADIVYRQ